MATRHAKCLTIGFSQGVMNHPFRIANVESMKAAARAAGVRLVVTDGRGDTEVEAANIDMLLDQGVDALVVSSLSGPAIYPHYRRVVDRGVPLVLLASGVPTDDTPYTSFVGPDEIDLGRRAAHFIGERLLGEGRVLVLRGVVESSNSRLRNQGFESALADGFPAIEVVGRVEGDWLRRSAFDAIAAALAIDDRIHAIFAENDEMALGAVDALRCRKLQDDVFVVGLDGQAEAVWEIGTGSPLVMTIMIEWDSAKALDVAVAAVKGREVPRHVVLDSVQIDAASAPEILETL